MLEKFNISNNDIFPVCVMATMSSGKSTFINAILGEEILPEKNEACTARALAVVNCDQATTIKAFIIKQDDSRGYTEIHDRTVMKKIDSDEKVQNVLIEMDIPNIHNIHKTLVLIDTPGVNNSEDLRHAERTIAILEKLDKGIIIYLLNATQLATNDDASFLQMVSEHIKKHPRVNICFILNKIDMLDEDKESIPKIVETAEKYIEGLGLANPLIYPLSALSAKILRLKLNDKYMTKSEQRHLKQAYKEYHAAEKNTLRYANIYDRADTVFTIDNEKISGYELKRAIDNTGITGIEQQIINLMIRSESSSAKQIFDDSLYEEWEGVYAKKKKTRNMVDYRGKVKWICKTCRQINGEASCCLNCGKHNVIWHKITK